MCVNVTNSESVKFVYNWNLPMWTIYNTLELDSECGFYSLIKLFQLTMSVFDPWLITKVNDTGLTPRQLLICLLLNVIVIS